MRKRTMTWLFCLLCSPLFPQSWVINYEGYPSGYTLAADAFMDEEGVVFLTGQEGESREKPETLVMRIEPDGSHSEYLHHKEHCHTRGTCILELSNHLLLVTGNCYSDTDDSVMVLILDKQLHLLREKCYPKEVDAISFGECKAILDRHGMVIVATSVKQPTAYTTFTNYGVFLKLDQEGNLVSRRYLIEDYPDPLYFITNFNLRQMWYHDDETFLCLAPGYGGVMAFITFDSAFNYIEEYPIILDHEGRSDQTLCKDCFTDYWPSDDEALVFSGNCDKDRNHLRVSRVNTHGEYLQYLHLHERPDTLDVPANRRCMATANDSTHYLSFFYHHYWYPDNPGMAGVYLLNDHLDIVGRYFDEDSACYRSRLILPTHDGGCLVVNCLCNCESYVNEEHPYIFRLSREDFETVVWSVSDTADGPISGNAYPNPTYDVLHIPINLPETEKVRGRIVDQTGRTVSDQSLPVLSGTLHLNVSHLRSGVYYYHIYTPSQTLLTERFVKP